MSIAESVTSLVKDYGYPHLEVTSQGMEVANLSTTVENDDWVLIVDAVILSATIVGALMIILSMAFLEWKGRPSTTRMRIVQSLVLSDLMLGVVGLIGVALALRPGGLQPGQACDGLGVTLVAVLWSEHLWTLSLAIATFMILIHPLHRFTLFLEKRWWILWILVWAVGFIISAASYGAYGVVPSGGICYYPSSDAALFGSLMQFIPRATVFLIITLLYAKLFVFLRRPDRIRGSYSSPSGSVVEKTSRLGSSSFKPLGVISNLFRKAPPTDYNKEKVLERRVSLNPGDRAIATGQSEQLDNMIQRSISRGPPTAPAISPTSEIPPWERVELPVFQIDGERFGGAASNAPAGGNSSALWGNWKGLGGSTREGKKRSSQSSSSPPSHYHRKFGSGSSSELGQIGSTRQSPPTSATPRLGSIPSIHDHVHVDGNTTPTPTPTPYNRYLSRGSLSAAPYERFRTFSLTSENQYQGGSLATSATLVDSDRRPSAVTQGSRRSSATPSAKKDLSAMLLSPSDGEDEERGVGDGVYRKDYEPSAQTEPQRGPGEGEGAEGEDGDWDLMQMLRQSAPPRGADDRFAPPGETVELVEESMASYLNRKTALLMLWFPLGYVLLFSVSLIRIIYDFAGKPPVVLRAISRWFIFSQGILDALIYGLVEWHTKRVVRRRVKKGTFSQQSQSAGSSSWPRILRSRRTGNSNSASQIPPNQTASEHKRDMRGSTISKQGVTFGRVEERSYLGALMPLEEKDTPALEDPPNVVGGEERRGSNVDSVATKASTAPSSAYTGVSGEVDSDVTGMTSGTNGSHAKKDPGDERQ